MYTQPVTVLYFYIHIYRLSFGFTSFEIKTRLLKFSMFAYFSGKKLSHSH